MTGSNSTSISAVSKTIDIHQPAEHDMANQISSTSPEPSYGINPDDVDHRIRASLTKYLSSNTTSTDEVVLEITASLTGNNEHGNRHVVPWFYLLWVPLLDSVTEASDDIHLERLGELIIAMSRTRIGRTKYQDTKEDVEVWTDLPRFDSQLNETIRFAEGGSDEDNKHLANIYIFLAYATDPKHPQLNWLHFGAVAMATLDSEDDLDYWLPIATHWLDLHGEAYLGSGWKNKKPNPYASGLTARAGFLWKGQGSSLKKARWDFWVQRLEELRRSNETKQRTRAIAEHMLDKMAEITKGLEADEEEVEEEDDAEEMQRLRELDALERGDE